MASNLDRYKKDLERLSAQGTLLDFAMRRECAPDRDEFDKAVAEALGEPGEALRANALPSFLTEYQAWYSEARALIKQLLPDRLDDFVRHYERPKTRKSLTSETYRIEDYLQGLQVGSGFARVVGPEAAVPHFAQQLAIVKAVGRRFETSLFDIQQLVQADLFDSELATAQELSKKGFARAAGALAGVVLERHLGVAATNHALKVSKKAPTITDLNEILKKADVVDLPQWRFIQHLGDLRNLCSHSKEAEPTQEQVDELIGGVNKIIKTLF